MPRKRPEHYHTLLRVRERQEDLRAQALAAARRDVAVAEGELAAIQFRQMEALAEAGRRTRDVFDAREVRLYYQFERYLARVADEKDVQVLQLRGVADQRRAELEDAMKRRRIVEKLIERQQRAGQAEIRSEEQKFADEVAGNYTAMVRRTKRGHAAEGRARRPVGEAGTRRHV